MGVGARRATGSIIRYTVIAIGFVVILQTAGIDLTTLNVLAGAVGIGLGFGLQNIVSNFVSGIIILFERPIKVGDRIVVGNVESDVVNIGDSGLNFELRVWSTTLIHRRGLLKSNLNYAIYTSFNEHGIGIPFPRRDIRILRDRAGAEPTGGNSES
nr:mechanosensitive ion channel domain-containing protein [Geobacter grbiciae]